MPFSLQKWYSNCAAKVPFDQKPMTSLGNRRSILYGEQKDTRQRGGDIVLLVPLTGKVLRIHRSHIECFRSRTIPTVIGIWVKFARRHRHDFYDPTWQHTSLCSANFEESCNEQNLSRLNSMEVKGIKMNRFLRNDTVPTRDTSFVRSVNEILVFLQSFLQFFFIFFSMYTTTA